VQSNNFTTLFVLSREREVEDSVLDVSFLCFLRNWCGTNADFDRLGSQGLDCWALTLTM
jgi:hypothetical protein